MKRYICVDCGHVFTGWGIGKVCSRCGGELELIIEKGEKKK